MSTASRSKTWQPALVCALLVLATLAVYWPVRHFDFINYDDPDYVAENQHVLKGISREGMTWAFGTIHGQRTYWHPLTWMSHMLDCQLFGTRAGAHHLTNLFFHMLNTLLVFLAFRRMTGATWRCAVLAGLFALHPLQVETVAWVAERKNLLATFFGLLALWAYALYAEKSKIQRPESDAQRSTFNVRCSRLPAQPSGSPSSILHPPSSFFYVLSLLLFALSLMSKPALVTLPCLLLLLDCWPLGRFQLKTQDSRLKTALCLVWEKLPFLALSAASSAITLLAHRGLGMLQATEWLPLGFRIQTVLVAYASYVESAFWPVNLAVLYPLPPAWPAWTVVLSGLLLLFLSALALGKVRTCPYLFVGWFWFLGTLVPFSGLIQVGAQAMADRFAYFPLVGLCVALVWTAAGVCQQWPQRANVLTGAAVVLLFLGAVHSRWQLGYWQDSVVLFQRALAVTTDNAMAHACLGTEFVNRDLEAEALTEFSRALALKPAFAKPLSAMGESFSAEGRLDLAAAVFRKILQVTPYDAEVHCRLASVVARQGRPEDAIAHYEATMRLAPDWAEALNNFAWLLATHPNDQVRDGPRAVSLAQRACHLTGSTNLWLLATLAAAYAEAGRFPDAVTTQAKVYDLGAAQGTTNHLAAFQTRLELYRAGRAYHLP